MTDDTADNEQAREEDLRPLYEELLSRLQQQQQATIFTFRKRSNLRLSVMGALTAAMVSVSTASVIQKLNADNTVVDSLPEQAEELARVLSDASQRMNLIEAQIIQRQNTVSSLEERAATAEAISDLNTEELAAVDKLLAKQLQAANNRSFWTNAVMAFGLSFFFYIAGLFSPYFGRKLGLMGRGAASA